MSTYLLKKKCDICGGDGTLPSGVACLECDGKGGEEMGTIETADLDEINGKIDTLTEMSKVAQEYLEKILSIVGKS